MRDLSWGTHGMLRGVISPLRLCYAVIDDLSSLGHCWASLPDMSTLTAKPGSDHVLMHAKDPSCLFQLTYDNYYMTLE